LKQLNIKAFATIAIILTVGLWLILLFLAGLKLEATLVTFKQLPTVLSIEMVIWGLFAKWGWRLRVFQGWLVPFPLIQGTWRGTLSSTWTNPETNQYQAPIHIILVVRQTFLTINCTLFTAESESRSHSASIHIDEDSGEKRLVYSYTNKPRTTVRDRSPIHDGTVSLQILGDPPNELRGEYWTSRKTTGEINLKFSSKSLMQRFTE
jgi:hypothetical protein